MSTVRPRKNYDRMEDKPLVTADEYDEDDPQFKSKTDQWLQYILHKLHALLWIVIATGIAGLSTAGFSTLTNWAGDVVFLVAPAASSTVQTMALGFANDGTGAPSSSGSQRARSAKRCCCKSSAGRASPCRLRAR